MMSQTKLTLINTLSRPKAAFKEGTKASRERRSIRRSSPVLISFNRTVSNRAGVYD